MKVSLWHQFSSNHSASFTVVGRFESQVRAQAVADEFETILERMSLWWDHLSRDEREAWNGTAETSFLTPPETELSQLYNVDWPFSLGWGRWARYRDVSPISVFNNLVFIENPHPDLHKGPQPFNGLMARFGGDVFVYVNESRSYPDTILLVEITCIAPDDRTAQSLVDQSNKHIIRLIADIKDHYIRGTEGDTVPWLAYHSGILDPRADELRRIEAQAFYENPIIEPARRAHRDLETQIMRAKIRKDEALETKLQHEFDQIIRDALGGQSPIDWKENGWVLEAMSRTRLSLDFAEHYTDLDIGARRDGTGLSFANLSFENWISGLNAFSAWLIAEGCTNIAYRFSQFKDTRFEKS
jgi:hypothetical protein